MPVPLKNVEKMVLFSKITTKNLFTNSLRHAISDSFVIADENTFLFVLDQNAKVIVFVSVVLVLQNKY